MDKTLQEIFTGDQSGAPYINSPKDLVHSLLQQAIGALDPTQGLLSKLILYFVEPELDKYLKNKLGSTTWNGVINTNMSATAIYEKQTQDAITGAGSRVSRIVATDIQKNYAEGLASLLTSKEDWLARSEANRIAGDAGYKRFIELEGQGWMSKLSWLSGLGIDLGGANTIGAALQKAVVDMTRQNRRQGYTTRDAIKAASDIAENIFTGDWDEELQRFTMDAEYVPSEWRGLTQANAAKLAAVLAGGGKLQTPQNRWNADTVEIAEDTGIDDLKHSLDSRRKSRQEDLRNAVEHARHTIKEYAAALEPLRDVFGDDMDKLLQALQNISGTSISRLSIDRVSQLSSQLSYALSSGLVSDQELMEGVSASNKALSQMTGLGVYNYLAGPEQATRALFAWKGQAFNPDYLTDSQARAHAQQLVSSTFNSPAADLFAKAYAIWSNRDEQQRDGADNSFAAFERAVQQNRAKSEDLRVAAIRTAGVSYTADLDYGLVYDEYRQAVLSGDAGTLAMQGEVDRRIARGKQRALAKYSGSGTYKLGSAAQVGANYDNIFEMLSVVPEIASMSDEARLEFLATQGEAHGLKWTRADNSVITSFSHGYKNGKPVPAPEAAEVNRYINLLKADTSLNLVLTAAGAQANMQREVAGRARFEARRKALEDINDKIQNQASSWYALVRDRDFSVEKLKERFDLSNAVLREDTVENEAIVLTSLAAQTAYDAVYKGKDPDTLTEEERKTMNPEAVEERRTQLMDYLVSSRALQNTKLTEVIEDLEALHEETLFISKQPDSADKAKRLEGLDARRRVLGTRMYAYSLVDPQVMDKFTSMAVYDEAGNRLYGEQAEKKRDEILKDLIHSTGSGLLSDRIKWSMLDSQILGLDQGGREIANSIVKQYKDTANKGSDGVLQVGEDWKKFFTEENKRISELKDEGNRTNRQRILNEVNSMMNAAGSGGGLESIGQEIVELLERIAGFVNPANNGDSMTPEADSSVPQSNNEK